MFSFLFIMNFFSYCLIQLSEKSSLLSYQSSTYAYIFLIAPLSILEISFCWNHFCTCRMLFLFSLLLLSSALMFFFIGCDVNRPILLKHNKYGLIDSRNTFLMIKLS
uniref:PH domain-containing protein n=1 Tax=Parascaris univalens TaxID=6257 RepID=A0A915BDH0_PARUN